MSRRFEVALLLVVCVAVGVALWAGRRRAGPGPELDPRASSLLSGPSGSSAVYAVLARLRVAVERRRTPLTNFVPSQRTGPRPALLIELDPIIPLLPSELMELERYVRGGGAVWSAGGGGGITRCVGWDAALDNPFLEDTIPVRPTRAGLSLPPVRNTLRQRPTPPQCSLPRPSVDTLLTARDGRPIVVSLHYAGGGSVTLLSDPGYLRNRAWRSGHAPFFIAPLLVAHGPGPIVWDEYHQGFGESASLAGATFAWLVGTPAGWAVLQLAAVFGLGLAAAAVRFGPARSVIERRRRSSLEHLNALAAALEGAGGVETAVRLTILGLRRRLSPGARSIVGTERRWLETLMQGTTPRGRRAVAQLERSLNDSEPGGTERLLVASQAVEDVWEELRPRTMRGAS